MPGTRASRTAARLGVVLGWVLATGLWCAVGPAGAGPGPAPLTDDARPSTGLSVPGALNWQREARRQV